MHREGERERERARACARERARACAHTGERVGEKALWLLFLYVFSSTWACPMQIGLSQECCLFCLLCLKSSLWSSDLPCLLATTILDSFSLFYLPNIPPSRDGRSDSLGIGASRSFWLLPAELGWRGVLGLPLASLNPQNPYSGVQGCVIFSVVSCSSISLLNWHGML